MKITKSKITQKASQELLSRIKSCLVISIDRNEESEQRQKAQAMLKDYLMKAFLLGMAVEINKKTKDILFLNSRICEHIIPEKHSLLLEELNNICFKKEYQDEAWKEDCSARIHEIKETLLKAGDPVDYNGSQYYFLTEIETVYQLLYERSTEVDETDYYKDMHNTEEDY
jgi:predicted PilT family ATPase